MGERAGRGGGVGVGACLLVGSCVGLLVLGDASSRGTEPDKPRSKTPIADAIRERLSKNRDGADAKSAKPAEPKAGEVAVGYRRMMLDIKSADGTTSKRQLDMWYPTSATERPFNYKGQNGFAAEGGEVAPGPHPLLVFSHGFLGVSDQSIFLTESCARAGYVVVSMNHGDSLGQRGTGPREQPRFAEPDKWSDKNFAARRDDVRALLNQCLAWNADAKSPWHGRLDADAIGGVGHSLGGYTLLGLAGGWPSWKEPRLKAVVALSPYAMPFIKQGDLKGIEIPIMLQGGTLDVPITPMLPPVFAQLKGPKVSLVLKDETHFGWTNLVSLNKTTTETASKGNAELIVRYTVAFCDQFVRGLDRLPILEHKDKSLHSLDSKLNRP